MVDINREAFETQVTNFSGIGGLIRKQENRNFFSEVAKEKTFRSSIDYYSIYGSSVGLYKPKRAIHCKCVSRKLVENRFSPRYWGLCEA